MAGTRVTIAPNSLTTELKLVTGRWTTEAAVDTVPTGLRKVISCGASFADDLTDDPEWCSVDVSATAGALALKTWKNTGGTDPTPAAAATFSKKVNWYAVGF
jgi:hypothetical protein